MKQKGIIKTLLPLLIICLVSATALSLVNQFTEEPIRQNTLKAQNAARIKLFPDANDFRAVEDTALKSDYEVLDASGAVVGHVIESAVNGFAGEIVVTVGIDGANQLTGIQVGGENFAETAGLGALAKEESFTAQFGGKALPITLDDIDVISGATITSRAVIKAIDAAYQSLNSSGDADAAPIARAAGHPENEDGWLGIADSDIGGELHVRVKLNNGVIEAVKVVQHNETAGLSDPAIAQIPEAIVAANSTAVDAVAGATRTSEAICAAVEDALLNAANPDAVPPVSETAEAAETAKEEPSGEMAAYAGIGNSKIGGPVAVAVLTQGDTIVNVTVLSHNETAGISDPAITGIPAAMVEANSADVDVVAGATLTSEAIIEAVKNALSTASETETTEAVETVEEVEATEPAAEAVEGTVLNGTGISKIGGELTVDVTMNGDTIAAVAVTSHNETAGISDPAINGIPAAMVEANSADVDVVAGATLTSEAIIEAVKNALSTASETETTEAVETVEEVEATEPAAEAVEGTVLTGTGISKIGGELTVEVTMNGDTIAAVAVTSHNETAGISDPAINGIPAAMVEANSADVDVVAGATLTSEAIIEAVKNALSTASETAETAEPTATETVLTGTGISKIGGELTVDVTMNGDTIAAVAVTSHNETAGISDPAINGIPAAMVEANSADVDVVAGATLTSEAIIEAVKNALSK